VVKDSKPTTREELYQAGLTNSALIEELKRIIPDAERSDPIYADAAEPARIAEIANAGFNIMPADKEVVPGILSVKSSGMAVTKDSPNLIKESKTYKWMKDKNGKVFDQPVKFNDHAMDATRYAWHTHNKALGNQFFIAVSGGI
jgi:phage terminase large subunit